jgi:hypothetical protein
MHNPHIVQKRPRPQPLAWAPYTHVSRYIHQAKFHYCKHVLHAPYLLSKPTPAHWPSVSAWKHCMLTAGGWSYLRSMTTCRNHVCRVSWSRAAGMRLQNGLAHLIQYFWEEFHCAYVAAKSETCLMCYMLQQSQRHAWCVICCTKSEICSMCMSQSFANILVDVYPFWVDVSCKIIPLTVWRFLWLIPLCVCVCMYVCLCMHVCVCVCVRARVCILSFEVCVCAWMIGRAKILFVCTRACMYTSIYGMAVKWIYSSACHASMHPSIHPLKYMCAWKYTYDSCMYDCVETYQHGTNMPAQMPIGTRMKVVITGRMGVVIIAFSTG